MPPRTSFWERASSGPITSPAGRNSIRQSIKALPMKTQKRNNIKVRRHDEAAIITQALYGSVNRIVSLGAVRTTRIILSFHGSVSAAWRMDTEAAMKPWDGQEQVSQSHWICHKSGRIRSSRSVRLLLKTESSTLSAPLERR